MGKRTKHNIIVKVRDRLASVGRLLPGGFKGRSFLGERMYNFMVKHCDLSIEKDFQRTVPMKDGYFINLDLRDFFSIEPFYTGRSNLSLIDDIRRSIRGVEKPLVLDIGANIGLISVPIAKEIESKGGVVHAFEPLEGNLRYLDMNRRVNRLDNLTIYRYGLGNEDGRYVIAYNKDADTSNAMIAGNKPIKENAFNDTREIEIKKLDDVWKEKKIDRCSVIKIDVEGYELPVLQGGLNFIKEYKPIIFGEFGTYYLRRNEYTMKDVCRLLRPLGYKLYMNKWEKPIEIQGDPEYAVDVFFVHKKQYNVC